MRSTQRAGCVPRPLADVVACQLPLACSLKCQRQGKRIYMGQMYCQFVWPSAVCVWRLPCCFQQVLIAMDRIASQPRQGLRRGAAGASSLCILARMLLIMACTIAGIESVDGRLEPRLVLAEAGRHAAAYRLVCAEDQLTHNPPAYHSNIPQLQIRLSTGSSGRRLAQISCGLHGVALGTSSSSELQHMPSHSGSF